MPFPLHDDCREDEELSWMNRLGGIQEPRPIRLSFVGSVQPSNHERFLFWRLVSGAFAAPARQGSPGLHRRWRVPSGPVAFRWWPLSEVQTWSNHSQRSSALDLWLRLAPRFGLAEARLLAATLAGAHGSRPMDMSQVSPQRALRCSPWGCACAGPAAIRRLGRGLRAGGALGWLPQSLA